MIYLRDDEAMVLSQIFRIGSFSPRGENRGSEPPIFFGRRALL